MIPGEKSRRVGGEKSDKADKSGNTDRCSYCECCEKQNIKSCRSDRNAEHSRFILPDRQCQHMAVEQENRDGSHENDQDRNRNLCRGDAGETPHDPVFDGGQLFFRIRHELQHHEKCLCQSMDRDSRENDGSVFFYGRKRGET